MVNTIPKTAVIHIHLLKTVAVLFIVSVSPEACAFEISLIALSARPKEENVLIRFKPDINKPFNPIPAVPMRMANALLRIRVIKILNT